MKTTSPGSPIDLAGVPRAVLSITLGVLRTVERTVSGDGRLPTARGNAWAAVCADRDRARRRDEIRRTVAALAATRSATAPVPAVGSTGKALSPAANRPAR